MICRIDAQEKCKMLAEWVSVKEMNTTVFCYIFCQKCSAKGTLICRDQNSNLGYCGHNAMYWPLYDHGRRRRPFQVFDKSYFQVFDKFSFRRKGVAMITRLEFLDVKSYFILLPSTTGLAGLVVWFSLRMREVTGSILCKPHSRTKFLETTV